MFETKNNKVQVQYWNLINKTVLQFFLSHSFTYSGSDDWCILMSNKIISYMSNVNKTLTWHEPWITDCFTWILISWLIKILGELSTVVWSPMYSKFQGTLVTAKTYMYIYNICINFNCPFFCKSTKKSDAPGKYTGPQTYCRWLGDDVRLPVCEVGLVSGANC